MAILERILIVGGGIAGLTAAIALRRRGFHAELVERNESGRTEGGGIALQPNAMRLLLKLGAGGEIERIGAPLHHFTFITQRGEVLANIDLVQLWTDVGPCVGVERAKLQDALIGATTGASRRLGVWVTSVDQKNGRVRVGFNDASSGEYDLLIGADGIGSTVRALAVTETAASYCGQMTWRSLAPKRSDCPAEVQFWLGDGCFFGLFPVSKAHTYGSVHVAEPSRQRDPPEGRLTRLRERFADFGGAVRDHLAGLRARRSDSSRPYSNLLSLIDGATVMSC